MVYGDTHVSALMEVNIDFSGWLSTVRACPVVGKSLNILLESVSILYPCCIFRRFTFMHLADAFIQSVYYIICKLIIVVTYVLSSYMSCYARLLCVVLAKEVQRPV